MEVVVTSGAIRRAKLQGNRHHQQQLNTQLFTGRMPFLSPNQQCQSTEWYTDAKYFSLICGGPLRALRLPAVACIYTQLRGGGSQSLRGAANWLL